MPGAQYDSNFPNFVTMSAEEFLAWKDRQDTDGAAVKFPVPAGAELTSSTPSQINLGSAAPKPEPRADVWSTKRVSQDFVCPSGQTCKLRPLQPQTLLERGLLDQIGRLEGLAAELVDEAEGQPPTPNKMPSSEDLKRVLDVLEAVIPLVVEEPKVYETSDKDAPSDAIRVSDIDLEDRMAILEESMKGLRALDRFRPAG